MLPPPPGLRSLDRLLDQLDELEKHLSAQHNNLRDYRLLQPMDAYRHAVGGSGLSAPLAQRLLRSMARQTARRSPPASNTQWAQTRDDMLALCRAACPDVPKETAFSEYLQALLLATQFKLAADFLRSQVRDHGLHSISAGFTI